MSAKAEKRKEILVNAAYIAFLIGMFFLFMEYAFGLFLPFVLAFFFALILQKPINFITRKTPLKKGLVSCILVLLLTALLVSVIGLLIFYVVDEVKGLFSLIYSKLDNLPVIVTNLRGELFQHIGFLPDSIEADFKDAVTTWTDKLISAESTEIAAEESASSLGLLSGFDFSLLSGPLSGLLSTAKQIPNIVLTTVITIVASCFMCIGYDGLASFVKRQLATKRNLDDLSSAKRMFLSSLKKISRTYFIIMCITFTEMAIGLYALTILGVYPGKYIFIIAGITALVDIFPILGTGTILIPWALVCFIIGKPWLGLGLAIIYACITIIRQVIEPKLVADNLGISPIMSLMGLYLGLKLFGFVGMILTPLIFTMIKLLNDEGIIHLWKTGSLKGDTNSNDVKDSNAVAVSDVPVNDAPVKDTPVK